MKTNKLESDLAIVRCSLKSCDEYGHYPRCYLDIFQLCKLYRAYEAIANIEKNKEKEYYKS